MAYRLIARSPPTLAMTPPCDVQLTHIPAPAHQSATLSEQADPELDALVREIIGRVADKWTMLILETLHEYGTLCFKRLGDLVGGVSQKMLTKTVRQMEADGLVIRTIFAVVPPRVEYKLTERGLSLGAAFCGVWTWAETHRADIIESRKVFAKRNAKA